MKVTFTFKSGKNIALTAEEILELKRWLNTVSTNLRSVKIKPLEFDAPEDDDGNIMRVLSKDEYENATSVFKK